MSISVKQLEDFIVKTQPGLETIKRELSSFNIFNVLGVEHREIRHSNFLGWLFDPNESHQLDDVFLKDLFKLMRDVKVLNADDFVRLLVQDLSDTQVYRESVNNIDILIVNEKLGLVICIENKIKEGFSDHQLKKYYDYVEENYSGIKTRVYLTLTRFKNENHLNYASGDNYTNISYQDIVNLLKLNNKSIENSIPTIRESIKQYIEMVEKSVVNNSDEVKLARNIYRKYKNEIEFIIKNKPDFSKQKGRVTQAIKDGLIGDFDIIKGDKHKEIIRLLPKNKDLQTLFKDPRFKSWNGDYLFTLELFVQKNSIWLKWCFGDIRNDKEKEACQLKKTKLVLAMKDFVCFKNSDLEIDWHKCDPQEPYTGICGVRLFWYETFLNQDKSFLEFFKDKFSVVNTKLIEPWMAECIEKLAD